MAESRESIRLAFMAALQHLPPRQRAVLILREVLRWKATEVAELLDTSVASVNSALQRARATLEASDISPTDPAPSLDAADRELLARYVEAFERYDMEELTSLLHEDATQSMPPYELWLRGRDDILGWWVGPGRGLPRLARAPDDVGERRRPRSGSTSRARPAQASTRGRCRCCGSSTVASPSSPSSSTRRRCSPCGASRRGSSPETGRRALEEAEQLSQLSRETLARQSGSTSHSPMKPTSARSSSEAPRSRT